MSEIRVGIIAEGTTDFIIIEQILNMALLDYSVICTKISPTEEELLGSSPRVEGFGWRGVFYTCRNLADRLALQTMTGNAFDLIVIHIDGDVSQSKYSEANIDDYENSDNLPCFVRGQSIENNCFGLKDIVLEWISDPTISERIAFCMPYVNTDLWAAYSLYLSDRGILNEEMSVNDLNTYLLRKGKTQGRLIRNKNGKIKKIPDGYRRAAEQLSIQIWNNMRVRFSQANCFHEDISDNLISPTGA